MFSDDQMKAINARAAKTLGEPLPQNRLDDLTMQTTGPLNKGWGSEGRKDDAGKDPWRLLPWDAVRAIVKVLAFGASKYEERNWEKGMNWSRPFDACIRHLSAWWEGEEKDAETGYSHLWHAGCCILFLIAFELRKNGKDDRFKITS